MAADLRFGREWLDDAVCGQVENLKCDGVGTGEDNDI